MDSILAQSYTDWECILVDDGSTDDSGLICEDYSKLDARFKVIHKDNQGVSAARNTGIKESTGEWLYFCDADDEMLQDGLNILIRLTDYGNDIVFGGYEERNEEGKTIALPRIKIQRELTKEETIIELYQPSYSHYEGYLWCKLFKADLIKKNVLFFAEDIFYNEDRLFIMECLTHSSDRIIYTSTPVYCYYRHPQSAYWRTKEQWNPRFLTDLKANMMMYGLVTEMTSDTHIHPYAKGEIGLSIKAIQKITRGNKEENPVIEKELSIAEKYSLSFWETTLLFFMRTSKRLKKLLVLIVCRKHNR